MLITSPTRVQEARISRVVAAPGETTTYVVNVGGRLSRMDAIKIDDHLCHGEMDLNIMNIKVRDPGHRPGATREERRRGSAVLMASVKMVDEEGRSSTNWEPLQAVAELAPCATIKYILFNYNAETVGRTHPGEQDAYTWAVKNASQEASVMRKAAGDCEELGMEYYALDPTAMGSLWKDETTSLNEKIVAIRQQTKHAFGQEIPVGMRRALLIDELVAADPKMKAACQGQSWAKAMEKEMLKFIEHQAFRQFMQGEKAPGDYQRVELFWVYDIKSTGLWKARLVAAGNRVNSDGLDKSLGVVHGVFARVPFLVGQARGASAVLLDLSNAYLHSSCDQERVFSTLGPEWPTGWAGTRVFVVKSIYGLSTAACNYGRFVAERLTKMGWKASEGDRNFWTRPEPDGKALQMLTVYVDDLVLIASNPSEVVKELQEHFMIKFFEEAGASPESSFYLGSDVERRGTMTYFSAKTYIAELLRSLEGAAEQGSIVNFGKRKVPMEASAHPEEDVSQLLSAAGKRYYQKLVGSLNWLVTIGRFDLCHVTASLSRFSSAPREGHLKMLEGVFGYLRSFPDIGVVVDPRDFPHLPKPESKLVENLRREYGDWSEEVSVHDPQAYGEPLTLTFMVDSDWAHDTVTRKSISGIVAFLGRTPIYGKATRQTAIETSSFAAEFSALRTATEVAVGLRLALRSFGVGIKGPCVLFGDNLGVVQNTTLQASPLKKRHTSISYHKARASIAGGMVWVAKVPTECNVADIFTKPLGAETFHGLVDRFLSRGGRLPPKLGDRTPRVKTGAREVPPPLASETHEDRGPRVRTTARWDEAQSGECER